MFSALSAITSVLLLTATGWFLRRRNFIPRERWGGMEDLSYWILFPALILINVGTSDFSVMPVKDIAIAVLGTFSFLAVLCLVLQPVLKAKFSMSGPRFTSIFQGVVRWNGFVAMAIAANSFGEEGVALVAVIMAIMIPAANLLCVIVLAVYAGGSSPTVQTLARELAKNPFIITVAAGLLINVSGGQIPQVITNYLTFLGSAALPIAVLCVGAALDLRALRRPGPALTSALLIRNILAPAIAISFALALGLDEISATIVVLVFSVPSAGASFVLAKKMGGDAKLMAEILTLQTVAAAITIPAWLVAVAYLTG
ncbi:transporter [Pseudovibrio japonicus]|uniref:Transporter n=1 Tax=Pseudovibrio japonicus TaxID=366534 RepID=A0ABQ3EV06_9HYPH|nr:AEC family transporter [Pseudovibrio japonicus]GHB48342.1 transporter [Pseudovibrio japonicus]